MIYNDEQQIRKEYPEEFRLIDNENKLENTQKISFVLAAVGKGYGYGGETDTMVVLFDVGDSEKYLYIWVPCVDPEEIEDGTYIEEYYLLERSEALKEILLVNAPFE